MHREPGSVQPAIESFKIPDFRLTARQAIPDSGLRLAALRFLLLRDEDGAEEEGRASHVILRALISVS